MLAPIIYNIKYLRMWVYTASRTSAHCPRWPKRRGKHAPKSRPDAAIWATVQRTPPAKLNGLVTGRPWMWLPT
jgi:hypothetical protein